MLNLIPVVMFLLMQGAGGDGLTQRQQHALLDLAQRAHASQTHREIETALACKAGVRGADLAFWVKVFCAVGLEPATFQTVELGEPGSSPLPELRQATARDGWTVVARPRDGPSAS